MTILALEFSSAQRSVAVSRDGRVVSEAVETGGRSVAAFGMIENALARAKMEREEIQVIAVGLGPGSYTGIRAAIALAQGWQLARDVKTTGVSSAAGLAAQAQAEEIFGRVSVIVDAQRGEFYIATYDISKTACVETSPLKILPLAELQTRAQNGELFIGPDAPKISPDGRAVFPRAAMIAGLASSGNHFVAGEKLEPIYLRETNFVKVKNQLPGTAPKGNLHGV
jgi:tRNA threonylcarbamoyladenosine biosynthesis protein TsaB